jgi:hypothetical protein
MDINTQRLIWLMEDVHQLKARVKEIQTQQADLLNKVHRISGKVTRILDFVAYETEAVQLVFLSNGKEIRMLNMTVTQFVPLAVQAFDAKGNPATVVNPSWSVDGPYANIAEVGADGLSCKLVAAALGSGKVVFTCQTPSGKTLTGALDVAVGPSEAVTVTINPGVPQEQ